MVQTHQLLQHACGLSPLLSTSRSVPPVHSSAGTLHRGGGEGRCRVSRGQRSQQDKQTFGMSLAKATGSYRTQALPEATSAYGENGSSLTDRHLAR